MLRPSCFLISVIGALANRSFLGESEVVDRKHALEDESVSGRRVRVHSYDRLGSRRTERVAQESISSLEKYNGEGSDCRIS